MFKRVRIALALAIGISLTNPVNAGATTFPGTLKKISVPSPEKDYPKRTVYIWTPQVSDDQVSKLPVVYFLHGWPATPNGLMSGTINALNDSFDSGASPFIAVFPDGNAITHPDSEWADSYDKKAMVETWLTTNVIKAVEGDNPRSKDQRAILGFSMGGYGAATIGIHHPELYSQVITLAGYFVIDDITNAFGRAPANKAKIAYQTPSNFLKNANQIRWFLGEAAQDYTVLIKGQASAWATKLKSKKASYKIFRIDGGHDYTFVSNEMDSVANWLKWA
jgi:S-formylglutathione hydrolase FrmB